MTILQWIQAKPFMTTARTILGTFTNQQSLRIQPSLHPVVNVLSKINLNESCITIFTLTFRYRCTYLHKTEILYWNTSVSDHCCLTCTNTTYKADTVIETIELDDKCKSIETQVCRKLPGHISVLYIMEKHFLQDMKKQRLNQSLIIKLVVMTTMVLKH